MDSDIKQLPVDLNNLKHQFPDSHKIHAYEHGSDGRLYVQFKSNANKVTYAYPDFPPERVLILDAAESKGKFFGKDFVAEFPTFERLPGTTQTVAWPEKKSAA
jgi:hypothetical protein